MSQKPNVVIFGGLDWGASSVVVQYLLLVLPAEPLVSFIRFIDKYSINPPTTYVPRDFLKLVNERKGVLEYRQVNLTNPTRRRVPILAVVTQCFRPGADGRSFAHIQIAQTFNISLNLAGEAANRQLKAYVRITPSFYDHRDEREQFTETDIRGWVPLDVRGVWFLEAIWAIGSLPGLPLVALWHQHLYGPGMGHFASLQLSLESFTKRLNDISISSCGVSYARIRFTSKTLPQLHGSSRSGYNSTFGDLECSSDRPVRWISSMPRENADAIAGVGIPPSRYAEVAKAPDAVQSDTPTVTVPLFNVVGGSDMTHEVVAREASKAFGVAITHSPDRLADGEYYERREDINGDNYGHCSEIINNSNPPVPDTPLSPYVTVNDIKETGTALDGSKI